MNPILHQWKWDFRRIRIYWILWIVLLILTTALRHLALSGASTRSPLLPLSTVMESVVIFLLGPLLVAFAVFTTPFSGSTVFWKTRPLASRALFWEKTIFILILVWIPVLLSRCLQYLLIDPDPSILTGVALAYAPLTLGLYLLTATWTAICSNLRSLTLCLAGTVGFAMLLGMLSAVVRRGSEEALIQIGSANTNSIWPTLITALFLTALLLAVAWTLGALLKRRTASAITAGLGILVLVSQNNLWSVRVGNASEFTHRSMELDVLDRDQDPNPSQSILYPQLAAPLPENQILRLSQIETQFVRAKDQQQLHSGSYGGPGRCIAAQLRRNYPPDSRFIRGESPHVHHQILSGDLGRDPGTFSGSYAGEIIEWKKLDTLPLIDGEIRKIRSYGLVRLGEFQSNRDDLAFLVSSVARTQHSGYRAGHPFSTSAGLFAILRHTETGTLVSQEGGSSRSNRGFNLSVQSVEFQIQKQALHTALGRSPTLNDLAEFELDLYALTPVGSVSGTFRKDNWIPFSHRPGDIDETVTPNDAWTKAVLPDDATSEQVDRYLDTLFQGIPRDVRSNDQKQLQFKFNAIGSTHLDRLIARLPVQHYVRHYIANTIRKHATRDHLPALLAAFERDPRLAVIFIQKRWQADAVSIARNHLRSQGPFYSRDAVYLVNIATTTADPAINDDLFRHFVLADGGHASMIKNLRSQPGFPIDDAIAQAWSRERAGLTSNSYELAYHAIRLGDPEALRRSIAHLYGLANYNHPEHDHKRALLDAGIDQPAGTDALAWAHTNFAKLQFDHDRKVFFLPK